MAAFWEDFGRTHRRIARIRGRGDDVELHEPGMLPVSEGKAVRVVDTRPRS